MPIPFHLSSSLEPRSYRPRKLKAEGTFKRDPEMDIYYDPVSMVIQRNNNRTGLMTMIIIDIIVVILLPIMIYLHFTILRDTPCLYLFAGISVCMIFLSIPIFMVPSEQRKLEQECATCSPIVQIKKNIVTLDGSVLDPSKISFVELDREKDIRIFFKHNEDRRLVLRYYKRPDSLTYAFTLAMQNNGVRIKYKSDIEAISDLSDDDETDEELATPDKNEIVTKKIPKPIVKENGTAKGHCSKCGAAIDEDLIECPRCGTSL
jgi:hypothetical protein